jgi:hypothetical protein
MEATFKKKDQKIEALGTNLSGCPAISKKHMHIVWWANMNVQLIGRFYLPTAQCACTNSEKLQGRHGGTTSVMKMIYWYDTVWCVTVTLALNVLEFRSTC